MIKRLIEFIKHLFGGAKRTNAEETAKVVALKEKYEKWGKEDKQKGS